MSLSATTCDDVDFCSAPALTLTLEFVLSETVSDLAGPAEEVLKDVLANVGRTGHPNLRLGVLNLHSPSDTSFVSRAGVRSNLEPRSTSCPTQELLLRTTADL